MTPWRKRIGEAGVEDLLKETIEAGLKLKAVKKTQLKCVNIDTIVHEPDVECISKGKAHNRYEFGCKVTVAATSRGGWFVGARASTRQSL